MFLASALRLSGACDSLPASSGTAVDFRAVQSIFDKRCTSCHTGSAAPEGLQLTEFRSFTQLVDVPSSQVSNLKRVKPGSAASSYLFQKINCDAPKSGTRMPAFDKLTLEEQSIIRDWINQGARAANEDPAISSGPSAAPQTSIAGQPISFSVAASDINNDTLAYLWDFGDGVTRVGAAVVHAYLAPGIFQASVKISDDRGGSVTATLTITIEAGTDFDNDGIADGLDVDDDNDGIPDAIEISLGTSSIDPSAPSPIGAGAAAPMVISSFSSKLDFARESNDKLSLKGTFTISGTAIPLSQQVAIVAGDLARSFQLNDRGSTSTGATGQFKLKIGKPDSTQARQASFSMRLSRAVLAAGLLGEELESAVSAEKLPQLTRVFLYANQSVFQADVTLRYSRKTSRSGALILQKN